MQSESAGRVWWGSFDLELDETVEWTIGPLGLWLHRGRAEWRLAHDWERDGAATGWNLVRPAPAPGDGVQAQRFAVRDTKARVVLKPRAADRPVVARPNTPFRVLPGQRTRIFLSSPLWVEIRVGAAPSFLCELPTRRLSDTWFGASTREGELCYALKTHARTELADMPRFAYRALTPVVIENLSPDALVVERLSLPIPFLSVYGVDSGEAWTEQVVMLHSKGGDQTQLDVRRGPPKEAEGATRIGEPRQAADKGHLFRAFGSLMEAFDLGD